MVEDLGGGVCTCKWSHYRTYRCCALLLLYKRSICRLQWLCQIVGGVVSLFGGGGLSRLGGLMLYITRWQDIQTR